MEGWKMTRTVRRALVLLAALAFLATFQLAGATTASAATTCKHYDGFHGDAGLLRNVRVCAAPGTDYPNYSGWGRVVKQYSTHPATCDFSLFPYDIDDPQPAIACIMMMPPPIQTWRWTGTRWVDGGGLQAGQKAYFAPYATGWRWAWTQQSGWVAIGSQHAAFRWQG
jgi:hypothetical protein